MPLSRQWSCTRNQITTENPICFNKHHRHPALFNQLGQRLNNYWHPSLPLSFALVLSRPLSFSYLFAFCWSTTDIAVTVQVSLPVAMLHLEDSVHLPALLQLQPHHTILCTQGPYPSWQSLQHVSLGGHRLNRISQRNIRDQEIQHVLYTSIGQLVAGIRYLSGKHCSIVYPDKQRQVRQTDENKETGLMGRTIDRKR